MKVLLQPSFLRSFLLSASLALSFLISSPAVADEFEFGGLRSAIETKPQSAPDLVEEVFKNTISSISEEDRHAWLGKLIQVATQASPQMAERIGQRVMALAPEAEEVIILAIQDVIPTCDEIAGTVYTRVENEPKTVLTTLEDYLAYHESCAPEIVAASILASKANPKLVGMIVARAVTLAPTQAAGISDAALRAAPDAAAEIQAAIDRVLGAQSDSGKGASLDGKDTKSGMHEYERDRPIDDWPRLFADVWLIAPSGGIIGAGGRIVTDPNPGPKKPGEEEPKKPGEEEPKKPGEEEPKKPGEEEPKQPGEEEPKQPGDEEPKEPGEGEIQ